jgi:ribosome-binding protein aMBF1 (putative translation factor)
MPSEEQEFADVLAFPTDRRSDRRSEPATLRTVVGDVLRAERHTQDRTLADVARRAAVSLSYLSEVERGRKEISSDLLVAVGDALDLTLVEVLERCVDRLRAQGGSSIQLRAA